MNMEKYWIIVDGKPQGPFFVDQITCRNDFNEKMPVWSPSMDDWSEAGNVEAFASALQQRVADYVEVDVENVEPQTVIEEPKQSPSPQWVRPADEIDGVKKPPSYLGWSVAMTVCCCLPAGVIGIIYSSMVGQKWMRGDVEGALKASERAQWSIIVAFVLGLVCWPFQMMIQGM